MSLYNMMFGTNPLAPFLLKMLDISKEDVPRFRNCFFLNRDGSEIVILTRTGGNNRNEYEQENKWMTEVIGYKFDKDDRVDNTYANFHYAVPEAFKSQIELLSKLGAVSNPAEQWRQMLEKLQSREDRDDPVVKRAIAIGDELMDILTEVVTK